MTRIADYLRSRKVEVQEIPHEPTHTALTEAACIGVPAREVAKAIVLDVHGGHALAVIPASERLDMGLVHSAVGDPHAHLASQDELQRDYPDYELGAFPPLGSLLQAPVYVDPAVMEHETIIFAAGTADRSLRARTQDVFRDENPTVVPLIRELNDKERELIGP
jgi:Ala-tRNA(Pro) deacylase